jgi:hypothetical protein
VPSVVRDQKDALALLDCQIAAEYPPNCVSHTTGSEYIPLRTRRDLEV